ncbi:hypothetical protein K435DRAFT_722494 [Dendrothele bispora CBS 962.96]|uniref:DNA mismatch repair protein MutL n=1 Tax=Dendrothele bispora (strain CBS 962.96) TaxID=1314807 RepID=A0A4S8M3R0_DENBC|nr:hypothetical protein K435DRAFT_722494 [Dendrothele bispora CBS 962.96]
MSSAPVSASIKSIDATSVHRITSGQVVIDLQTAVKELVENSLDAGATNIEVRFKNYGLNSVEVIDNGSGIADKDHDSIGRKHHTSKLSSFNDLTTVTSFGFRGEALSSLCALCESVTITTATVEKAPMGTVLDLAKSGEVANRGKAVRQRGTTVLLKSLFSPLPVRRKEFERNVKREFGKALALLNAYALGPCCGLGSEAESSTSDTSAEGPDSQVKAVRLLVTNQPDKGQKATHISIPLPRAGALPSVRVGVSALWGPKALDGTTDLDLKFDVPKVVPRNFGRKQTIDDEDQGKDLTVRVDGLISSPLPVPGSGSSSRSGTGRSGTDRQFFFVNGRPCSLTKIQKVVNETYRSFSPSAVVAAQFPFIVANFTLSGEAIDVNVTPDKRTVLLHAESHIVDALKTALEELFQPSRSTFGVSGTSSNDSGPSQSLGHQRSASMRPRTQTSAISNLSALSRSISMGSRTRAGADDVDEEDEVEEGLLGAKAITKSRQTKRPQKDVNADAHAPNDEENEEVVDSAMDVDTYNSTSTAKPSTGPSTSGFVAASSITSSTHAISSRSRSPTPPLAKALVKAIDNAKQVEKGKEKEKEKSTVVLSTSKASWSRVQASSSSSASVPPQATVGAVQTAQVGSTNEQVPSGNHDSNRDEDEDEGQEPPRKRRKSSLGLGLTDKRLETSLAVDDEDGDESDGGDMEVQLVSSSSSRMKHKVPASMPSVQSRVVKPTGSTVGLHQTRLTDSFKGKGATVRRDLRNRLAGFARTGSQVPQPSSDAEEGEDAGDEDDEDEASMRKNNGRAAEKSRNDEGVERDPGGKEKDPIAMDEDTPLFLPGEDDAENRSLSNNMDLDLDQDVSSSSAVSLNTSSVHGPPSTAVTSVWPSSSSAIVIDDDDEQAQASSSVLSASERDRQLSESRASQPVDRPEVIRTASSQTSDGDIHLRFNLAGITRRWSSLREKLRVARGRSFQIQKDVMENPGIDDDSSGSGGSVGEDTTLSDNAQEAEAQLARVIDKKDFGRMDIIGQFNLGFIIVRKRGYDEAVGGRSPQEGGASEVALKLDDLFIVDQHAADEKYNFETLQQTTNIQSQKLFRPQPLELTASDELVALENLDILKKNGFELEVREDDPDVQMMDDETSGTQTRRLSLVAQPVSKSTVFGMKDLEELIHLMQDRPTGQMVRCSKARAMFASRACRKSVMVGMPLTKGQMTTVVQHMGTMDQPWNCPHGRPTMRHLFDMSNINSNSKPSLRTRKTVDWSSFA